MSHHTDTIESIKIYPLYNGLAAGDLPEYATRNINYKHGIVYDVLIGLNKQEIRVPSKKLNAFAHNWGLPLNVHNRMRIHYKDRKNTIDLSKTNILVTYECNSREIFKPINALKKMLKAERKIRNNTPLKSRPLLTKTYKLTTTRLLYALLSDVDILHMRMKLIYFSPFTILEMLDNPGFRHYYKLAHPDTTFYHNGVLQK